MAERIPVWRKGQKLMRLSDLDRDPRRDPRPGDILERKYKRRVLAREKSGKRDVVTWDLYMVISGRISRSIQTWRKWAANATVIRRAELGTGERRDAEK